jgi:hypothetical protein
MRALAKSRSIVNRMIELIEKKEGRKLSELKKYRMRVNAEDFQLDRMIHDYIECMTGPCLCPTIIIEHRINDKCLLQQKLKKSQTGHLRQTMSKHITAITAAHVILVVFLQVDSAELWYCFSNGFGSHKC